MAGSDGTRSRWPGWQGDLAVLTAVAVPLALAHALTITAYGLHRDEFYYVACGRHLAWGYVDHPPLIAVLAWIGTHLLGGSIAGLRAIPVALGLATIYTAGAVVRRLGGDRYAQVLAAAACALAPALLFTFHVLSMNASEVFLWTLAAWLLLVALDGSRAAWIGFGVACGLGLLNKISMGIFGAGLAAGLLLTPGRRWLRTPWPWVAAALAVVMFLPHLAWQQANGWPTREFIANAQQFKIADNGPAAFLFAQVLMMHPAGALLALGGVWFALRPPRREHAVLFWAVLFVTAVFLVQRSKPAYMIPLYPVLFAAGGAWTARITNGWMVARAAVLVVLVGAGVALAPLTLPVLPESTLIEYQRRLGIEVADQEKHESAELPQHFADMHGWEEYAREVSRVYQSLPEAERATARVLVSNYGEAGAIDYYASRYPLPRAISPHNNYWFWGPGPDDGGTMIIVGGTAADYEGYLERVDLAGRTSCRYCMPYENDLPIYVGRGWKARLSEVWPRVKRFI